MNPNSRVSSNLFSFTTGLIGGLFLIQWIWTRGLPVNWVSELIVLTIPLSFILLSVFFEGTIMNPGKSLSFPIAFISLFLLFFSKIKFAGVFLALSTLVLCWKCYERRSLRVHKTIFVGFVTSVIVARLAWCDGYLTPLFIERIMKGQNNFGLRYGNPDTLFHTAISNMTRTFYVLSTGLDGPIRIHYHGASHWFFGLLANISGFTSLDSYNLGFPIVIVPLFIAAFLIYTSNTSESLGFALRLILLFMALSQSLLPSWLCNLGFITNPFTSESYTLSLVLAFSSFALIQSIGKISDEGKVPLLSSALQVALCGLCAFTKISVGFFVLFSLLFWILHRRLYRRIFYTFWALANAGCCLVAYLMATPTFKKGLQFGKMFEDINAHPFVFFGWHFAWLWLYLLLRIINGREKFVRRTYTPVNIEMLLCWSALAILAGNLKDLLGNWVYFTDIVRWVSIAGVVTELEKFFSRKPLLHRPFAIVLSLVGCLIILDSKFDLFHQIRADKLNLILEELSEDRRSKITLFSSAQPGDLTRLPNFRLIRQLEVLENTNVDEKRQTLIYIPRSNSEFWNIFPSCSGNFWIPTTQFLVPAFTGMAMIDGAPLNNCHPEAYEFNRYTTLPLEKERTPSDLCLRAKTLGFKKVIELKSSKMDPLTISCTS